MEKTASDIMTTGVVTTTTCAAVSEVAEVLAANRISGMPVVSEGEVVGIISEADILTAAEGATVGSVMASKVVSVGPDTDVADIAKTLAAWGIKRVPVIDCGGSLVGIVSRADVVAAIAAD